MDVRALARPGGDTSLLDQAGLRIVRGDLQDAASLLPAVEGVDAVFHCAAKVGDWGPVEDFRRINVEGLRHLLDACKGQPLKRFLHFSSLGVYAARHHYGTDETEPVAVKHLDGYTQSKVESEQLALQYQREHHVPVVVLRPGFVYGPRDRAVLPKIIENLRNGKMRYAGSGHRALNTIYVGNLVDAALLAMEKGVAGQIYNLTDGERVSKQRFIDGVAEGMGLPRPTALAPPWLARLLTPLWAARIMATTLENRARRKGKTKAPSLTQAKVKFLLLNLDFSIEKAKRELGYRPRIPFDQALAETIAWYKRPGADLPGANRGDRIIASNVGQAFQPDTPEESGFKA